MRTLILPLFTILFSVSAMATSTTPALVVPEEKIFPCSIGVRHPNNGVEQTGGRDFGQFDSNQGKFTVASPYGQNVYSSPNTNPWVTYLDELKFDLASESYGSQYYVEFCYLGPKEALQTNYAGQTSDTSKDIYSLSIDIDIRNLIQGNVPYAEKARLFSKYEIACDLRGTGSNLKPRAEGETPSGVIESDISWSSSNLPIFNGALNFESQINQTPGTTPRFCTIRVYFSEGVKTLRNHHDVLQNFQIYVDVKKGKVNGLY